MSFSPFFIALAASLALTPVVRYLSTRFGQVVDPRSERWHKSPTPTSGGVAIFLAFLLAALLFQSDSLPVWGLLGGAGLAFLVGLIDDVRALSPAAKLAGQVSAAAIIVFTGNVTAFFSSDIANILISLLWLVAMSNALNLLDNMDGLSSGTTLVGAGFLTYFFFQSSNTELLPLALGVGGAVLGFLFYNFPPASIFMGDSGSLFLGILLAGLAIAREPQASNVFAILGVPVLILILPILDTSMVSLTRLLRGQSPAVGGRDHMSHRLVSLGLSERQVLLLLIGVSLLAGLAAVFFESLSYSLSLILIPIVILGLALFTAFLGQLRLDQSANRGRMRVAVRAIFGLTSRFRLFEVLLDVLLVAFAYYLAYAIRFGLPLSEINLNLLLTSYPIVLGTAFLSLLLSRVYQSVWRYSSIRELLRLAQASVFASIGAAFILVIFYRFEGFSRQVFLFFPIALFFLLAVSRFSFRFLESTLGSAGTSTSARVLIYGAGDAGELAIREINRNKDLSLRAVGFIDDDDSLHGREIHGVRVLGSIDQIERLATQSKAEGLLISSRKIDVKKARSLVIGLTSRSDFWIKKLRVEFDEIN